MIYFYIFQHFIFYCIQATIQYPEITVLGKTKGFKAAESGDNSINEENTDENEETEDSTGADDEK